MAKFSIQGLTNTNIDNMALKPITLKDTAQTMYGSGSAEFGIKENIQAAAGKVKSGATMLKRKAGMALREAASKGSEMAKGAAGAARSKGSAMAREAAGVARTEGGKFVSKAKGKASNSAKKVADMVAKKRAAAGFRTSSNTVEFGKGARLRSALLGKTKKGKIARGVGAAAALGAIGLAAKAHGDKKKASAAVGNAGAKAWSDDFNHSRKIGMSSDTSRGYANEQMHTAMEKKKKGKFSSTRRQAEFAIPNPFKRIKKSGVVGAVVGKTTAGKVARVGALAGAVGLGLAAKRYGGQAGAAYGQGVKESRTGVGNGGIPQAKRMDAVIGTKKAAASVGGQIRSDVGMARTGVTNAATTAAAKVKKLFGGIKKPKI